ncbi:MAG: sigma-70 family RNA polymerase sigma factor [Gaiellaceae bacterium]
MEVAVAAPRLAPLPAPRRDPDGELVVRVARGDRGAFETLYRRYVRSVHALALRRLGQRESAEDAVQETFAAVWRSARTYRPERGAAAPWLFSIARNATVDRLRARVDLAEPPDAPDSGPGPPDRAERDWLSWRVHRALEELPETEREVLALAYWGGRSQSEIAEELGIPLGTVKTRTRSGLARLAAALEDEELR